MAYVKGNSSPLANLDVLDKIIATRHKLAQVFHFHLLSLKFVKNNAIFNVCYLCFPFAQTEFLK